jgi:hypothetical protein
MVKYGPILNKVLLKCQAKLEFFKLSNKKILANTRHIREKSKSQKSKQKMFD